MAGGNGLGVEKRKFDDKTITASHGSMSGTTSGNPVAGSNGTEAMMQSWQNWVEKMSFASNTTSTSHSSLTTDVHSAAAASGPASCMFAGGHDGAKQNTIEMISYDAGATAQDFGILIVPNYGLKGGSGNA